MDLFRARIRDFILAQHDARIQYRIRDDAFRSFDPARSDPRTLLEMADAREECPPTHYRYTLDIGPEVSAAPPTPGPPPARLSANENDRKCEELAGSPLDREKVGNGVSFGQITVSAALPVCQQAAARPPARARYQYLYGRVLAAATRYEEAAVQFTAADRAGSALGAYYLASLYESGLGRPKDLDEAVRLYRKAGDAGIPDAYARVGAMRVTFAEENVRRPDLSRSAYAEAEQWLQVAANRGATTGLANLGWLYEFGLGVPQDLGRAARLYNDATRVRDPLGTYRLGLFYRDGVAGLQRNLATACQLFQQAAQSGSAYAQGELGICYYTGEGMPRDPQAAFGWFLRAAEAGVARAQEFVGEMYEQGEGVTQSDTKAVEWYRAAAAQSDPYGMFQLGAHLRMGKGVRWNEAEAMQWFQKAADLGEVASMTSLAMGYHDGLGGGPQDYRLAARWFGEAARYRAFTPEQEFSVGWAQISLARLHERGWGVMQDYDRARRLYAQASGNRSETVVTLARQYLSALPTSARGGPAMSDPQPSSSNLVPALIVGGLAILLIKGLMHSGSAASDTSVPYMDWTPQKDFGEQMNDRALVGCLWDELSYLRYGHC